MTNGPHPASAVTQRLELKTFLLTPIFRGTEATSKDKDLSLDLRRKEKVGISVHFNLSPKVKLTIPLFLLYSGLQGDEPVPSESPSKDW